MTDTIERPRLKITYATLRNDNDELHAQFEKGLEQARAHARQEPSQLGQRHRARRRGHVREALADRRLARGHVRQGHTPGCPGRDRRGARGIPGLVGATVAGARRDPAARGRPHQRAADDLRRAARDRGRQEPARGARRRRGDRRSDPLVVRHGRAERRLRPPDGQPGRRGRAHALGAQAVRRVGHHQPVQLPVRAERRPIRRRARGRQHGRLQAVSRTRRCRACA